MIGITNRNFRFSDDYMLFLSRSRVIYFNADEEGKTWKIDHCRARGGIPSLSRLCSRE